MIITESERRRDVAVVMSDGSFQEDETNGSKSSSLSANYFGYAICLTNGNTEIVNKQLCRPIAVV